MSTEPIAVDDEVLEELEDEALTGELEESETDSELSESVLYETASGAVIDLANPELNYEQAQELTEHIRATADMMYVLIHRAHAGKAWKALGYDSFKDYVAEEFNISRSRAYQFLDQARVVQEITAAAPEGTEVNISEADARDLKSALDELVPEIKARTANLGEDEDAGEIIDSLVSEYRERGDDDFDYSDTGQSYDEELAGDQADRDGFSGYSAEGAVGAGQGSGQAGGQDGDDDFDDLDDLDDLLNLNDDANDVRHRFESVYALYTSLAALKEMPNVSDLMEWIPDERKIQITSSLPRALEWLTEFAAAWDGSEVAEDEPVEEESDSDPTPVSDDVDDIFDEFN